MELPPRIEPLLGPLLDIATEYAWDAMLLPPSLTATVKLKGEPLVVEGVPVMEQVTPVTLLHPESPVGSVPVIVQVSVPIPQLIAVRVWE